jgi:hypothetical protein
MPSINNSRAPKATAAQRLRELLADSNRIIVAPGVYEGISARIALSLGFDALYMVWFCNQNPQFSSRCALASYKPCHKKPFLTHSMFFVSRPVQAHQCRV